MAMRRVTALAMVFAVLGALFALPGVAHASPAHPPVAGFLDQPVAVEVGQQVDLRLSLQEWHDPVVNVHVSFGDGPAVTLPFADGGSGTMVLSHSWTTFGAKTVTAQVTDDAGGQSLATTTTVYVADIHLTTTPTTGAAPLTVTVDRSASQLPANLQSWGINGFEIPAGPTDNTVSLTVTDDLTGPLSIYFIFDVDGTPAL